MRSNSHWARSSYRLHKQGLGRVVFMASSADSDLAPPAGESDGDASDEGHLHEGRAADVEGPGQGHLHEGRAADVEGASVGEPEPKKRMYTQLKGWLRMTKGKSCWN